MSFPNYLRLAPLTLALAILSVLAVGQAGDAQAIKIEPVVWQMDEDYPSDLYTDTQVPVQTVYIKTHDVEDWMSTYDPQGVSGIPRLQEIVRGYNQLGIDVVAWFVPGVNWDQPDPANLENQRAMARAVIDSGVEALDADVEPFDGFCNQFCQWLTDNLWVRLRAERPDATLGVIYDPRPDHRDHSGLQTWLSVANVALPMCYWDMFEGQPPYDDPAGCVRAAHSELQPYVGGRTVEYVPMLQGDGSPEDVVAAVWESQVLGLSRVSIWRRGVTSNEVWNAIRPYADAVTQTCARALADGCLLRADRDTSVWVIYDNTRYRIRDIDAFNALGYESANIQVVPGYFMESVRTTTPDGTLLREAGTIPTYVVAGGAKFLLTGPVSFGNPGARTQSL